MPSKIPERAIKFNDHGISVKAYGAKGNGAADDTAAINAAINALPASGGVIIIPDGTYMINAGNPYNTITNNTCINLKSNVHIVMSAGAILKKIGNSLSNATIFLVRGVNNVTIQGGTLLGDRYRRTGGDLTESSQQGMGFWLEGADDVRIIDVTCKEFWGDAVYTKYNATYGPNKNLKVRGLYTYDCRRQGISLCAVDGVSIDSSTFELTNGINGTGPSTGASAGIDLEPELSGSVFNVNIANCTFRNNRVGINAGSATGVGLSHVSITNCTFVDNTTYGLRIATQAQHFTAGHNAFDGNTINGIYVNEAKDIIISDNTVTGSGADGIYAINNCDRLQLSNNKSSGNTGWGIFVTNCDSLTLSDNDANNNMQSGIQIEASDYVQISGGRSHNNTKRGIYLYNCNFSKIAGVTAYQNGTNGIQFTDVEDSQLINCNAYQNSQTTNLDSDNINISGASINVMIQGNQARKGALANGPRYGIFIDATVSGTYLGNNDLRGGGLTADLSNLGSGTVEPYTAPVIDATLDVSPSGLTFKRIISDAGTPTWVYQGLAYDMFDRADSTTSLGSMNVGGAWSGVGTAGIISNQAYFVSDANDNYMIIPAVATANYTIKCRISGTIASNSVYRNPQIIVRFVDANNFIRAYLMAGRVYLDKKDGGVNGALSEALQATSDGITYSLMVACKGNNIKVYVDGVLKIDYTLLTADATKFSGTLRPGIRLGVAGAPATAARFDNFIVEQTP